MSNDSSKADRKFFRLEGIDVPVEYKVVREPFDVVSTEYKSAKLKDISAGGLSFVSEEKISIGADTRVKLPVVEGMLHLMGQVVRVLELEEDEYETAIKFISIDEQDQDKIVGFIFQKQLEMRRRGLR